MTQRRCPCPGVTPDGWINHLYARSWPTRAQRGFVLSRTGSSLPEPRRGLPGRAMVGPHLHPRLHRRYLGHLEHARLPGPAIRRRGQHRRAVRQQRHRQLPRPAARDPADDRRPVPPLAAARNLPADTAAALRAPATGCPGTTRSPPAAVAASFLRLREALVPYTYTLADQATGNGLPMTRPLYLDYPGAPEAYTNPGEYLLGSGHARRPGDHARATSPASRSGSRPGRGPTGSPAPRSPGPRPRRSPSR